MLGVAGLRKRDCHLVPASPVLDPDPIDERPTLVSTATPNHVLDRLFGEGTWAAAVRGAAGSTAACTLSANSLNQDTVLADRQLLLRQAAMSLTASVGWLHGRLATPQQCPAL